MMRHIVIAAAVACLLVISVVAAWLCVCDRVWSYTQNAYPPAERGRCVQAWSGGPEYARSTLVTICTKPNLAGGRRCHFHTPWWDNMEPSHE